jgi:lactoylglutathione lyase
MGGDEMADRRTGRGISDIRTIGIPVVDQEKAMAFYIDKLGFETRLDVPMGESARWIEVAPSDAAITIALIRAHDGLPAGVETGIRFTTRDAESNQADFLARGIDTDEVLRWPGVPAMFAFRDQDGNGLEVVEVPTTQAAGNPSRM